MSFTTEAAAMAEASRLVHDIADSVSKENDQLGARVDSLLGGGWTGAAADQYSQAWQDWQTGMREILSGLRVESQLITSTQAAYDASDDDSTDRMSAFGSRLQTRLG